ncbi:MAG: phosphatidate cytidylyltransferase [Candidatus Omnitrophica bacterium]|nr:phosphatidate cytidylyltransferase [Candidatus Omnitrophota bacterium]
MNKFVKRTIVSLVLIGLVYAVVYSIPNVFFCLVIALFVGLGQFEFFRLVQNKGIFVYKYFGTIVGILVPVVIFMGNSFPELKNLEPILIVAASLFAFTMQFLRKDNAHDHLVSTALTLFSLFYVSWFFSFFIKLKFLENGANLIAFLIIATKSADIGAYVVGSLFGKNELIPRISPKKTIEGTLGGVILSLIFSVTLGRMLTGFSVLHLSILGILMATLGQIGDLAESLIKRDCGVKDSGKYFAGIGGMLDLIDSLLFTAPVFYFYVKTF